MSTSAPLRYAVIASLSFLASSSAYAHLTYRASRDFGIFTLAEPRSFTISGQTTTAFSWADATDDDFGKQDDGRYFQFTLEDTTTVFITATGEPSILLPAYSVYGGRGNAIATPDSPDYDTAPITLQYLASLPGPAKEGSVNALATWRIGNDLGTTFADLATLTYIGHAADGIAANYGTAPGITGDGVADHFVAGSFVLPGGSYTLFVGGADYTSPDTVARPVSVTVSTIPEPSSVLLIAGGLSALSFRRNRPNHTSTK